MTGRTAIIVDLLNSLNQLKIVLAAPIWACSSKNYRGSYMENQNRQEFTG